LLVAVYFLPSFLVVAIGKGQLQNRHPKARHPQSVRHLRMNFFTNLFLKKFSFSTFIVISACYFYRETAVAVMLDQVISYY
jgi:hypothetical protein